jgi:hypothetical protein
VKTSTKQDALAEIEEKLGCSMQKLPEKVEHAIKHLQSMFKHQHETLCRLNTAIELLENYKRDLERKAKNGQDY